MAKKSMAKHTGNLTPEQREAAYRIGAARMKAIVGYEKKLANLTPAQISELVEKVAYVGDGEVIARNEYNLTFDELTEFMLDHGYEKCVGCKWFVECSELLGDDNEPKLCANCN